jgi:hypothetical protein
MSAICVGMEARWAHIERPGAFQAVRAKGLKGGCQQMDEGGCYLEYTELTRSRLGPAGTLTMTPEPKYFAKLNATCERE